MKNEALIKLIEMAERYCDAKGELEKIRADNIALILSCRKHEEIRKRNEQLLKVNTEEVEKRRAVETIASRSIATNEEKRLNIETLWRKIDELQQENAKLNRQLEHKKETEKSDREGQRSD